MIQIKKYDNGGDKTKLYADLLMTFSMGAIVIVQGMPISHQATSWINTIIAVIGLGGKLLTNVVQFKHPESCPPQNGNMTD